MFKFCYFKLSYFLYKYIVESIHQNIPLVHFPYEVPENKLYFKNASTLQLPTMYDEKFPMHSCHTIHHSMQMTILFSCVLKDN